MGILIYSWPKQLSDCWSKPMQRIGFEVQQFDRGGIVRYLKAKVRVQVADDGSAVILGWSLPWNKRRKLGYEVERILLASGMQAFFNPRSSNFIYRVCERPTSEWLEQVKPERSEIHYRPDVEFRQSRERYFSGSFKSGKAAVRFWTGPAINPDSKMPIYYLALGSNDSSGGKVELLKSLDHSLTTHGATRLEVQRELDR